jgi:hypothetical protein
MKGSSQLTINGNLTIPASREFKLSGNGLLKVNGNTYGKTLSVQSPASY